MSISRRTVMAATGALAFGSLIGAAGSGRLHLASNVYPWGTFYGREGKDFNKSMDAGLAEVAAAGLDGFEPIIGSPQQIDTMIAMLGKHGLEMRSFYVNSSLHTADEAKRSIEQIVAIGRKAREAGTRIIVTNPNPIKWGGTENKDDAMLRTQARALDELGGRLAEMGITLSYHFHDPEFRAGAREFHHMMCGTDARLVTLCLDAHWVYRGTGNSAVAVMDVVRLYGPRISELHLRQSRNHVWTEAFEEGDIDYPALAEHLRKLGVRPHVVLEQAVESGSPRTMNALEAHRKGVAYARKVFADFA